MASADPYGTAYVTVLADLDKFEKDLSKKMQKGLDEAGKSAKFDEFDKSATKAAHETGQHMEKELEKGLDSKEGELKRKAEKTGASAGTSFMTGLRRVLFNRGSLYTLLGGAVAGLAGSSQGLGSAALASIPALALGAAGAIATLTFSLHGFMSAIGAGVAGDTEAFNAALAKLAPSARSVVREIVGLTGVFTQLQLLVQQQFFAPLQGSFQQLARSLLPILRAQLPELAKTFGLLGQSFLAGFSYYGSGDAIGTILKDLNAGLRPFVPLLAQAVNLFLRVGAVAAPFLTQLSILAAGKFSDFLVKLDTSLGNGGVLKFFSEAGDFLVAVGGALGPILGLLGDILGAFAQFGSPTLALIGTLATTLRTALAPLLGPLAGFLGSLVTAVGKILVALTPGLTAIFGAVGTFFDAISAQMPGLVTALMPFLTMLSGYLTQYGPLLGQMLATLATGAMQLLIQALTDLNPLWEKLTPLLEQWTVQVLPQLVPLYSDFVNLFLALLPVLPPIVDLFVQFIPLLIEMLPLIVMIAKAMDWWLTNVTIPMITFVANLVGGFIELITWIDRLAINWGWKPMLENMIHNIQTLVGWIQSAVDWFNKLLGKQHDSKMLPQSHLQSVPQYATGGLVTSPTLAMVGEGGQPEAIVPMGSRSQARQVAQQTGLLRMLGTSHGGWSGTVHVYIGDREITDIVDVVVDNKLDGASDNLASGTRGWS